jgi:hypothetical protein
VEEKTKKKYASFLPVAARIFLEVSNYFELFHMVKDSHGNALLL